MTTLYIDTRDNKKIRVLLTVNKEKYQVFSKGTVKGSEIILKLINDVLRKAEIELSQIDKIEVERGPGSFTGVRVGVSVANALSLTLNKRINGKKLGELETPVY